MKTSQLLKNSRSDRQSGIGLVMAAVTVMALMGVLALCFDLARIYGAPLIAHAQIMRCENARIRAPKTE